MKKLLILSCIVSSVIVFTGYNTLTTERVLELPEVAFDYSVDIPSFFQDNPNEGGYGANAVIPVNLLDFIDNDIATLGRVLFYDTQLSMMGDIACASCHLQENSFAEPKQFSDGTLMMTQSNSMQLNDLGWSNDGLFLWDMHLTDLREVVKLPFTLENENGLTESELVSTIKDLGYYDDLFSKAFDDTEPSLDKVSEALTHFISSINSFNSRFDEVNNSSSQSFTQDEQSGMEVFSMQCSVCHSQGTLKFFDEPLFDQLLFSNGIELNDTDIGAGTWNEELMGSFKKTTLRNWKYTAPYMHDGRFATIEEVLDHYDGSESNNEEWDNNFLLPFGLDEEDKDHLLTFLETLNDESLQTNEKWADPFTELANTLYITEITLEANVFPNPSNDVVNISYYNKNNDLALIEVYDNTGKLILKEFTSEETYQVNNINLSPGNYHVKVTLNGKKFKGGFVYQ